VVIIKCMLMMKQEKQKELHDAIAEMAKTGVILLPAYCELLNEVPPDTEIVVIKEKER